MYTREVYLLIKFMIIVFEPIYDFEVLVTWLLVWEVSCFPLLACFQFCVWESCVFAFLVEGVEVG